MSGGFLALQQNRRREKRKLIELEDAFKGRSELIGALAEGGGISNQK